MEPEQMDCWIQTDLAGFVTALDVACAKILNLKLRSAVGRNLLLFFPGSRDRLARELAHVSRGRPSTVILVRIFPLGRSRRDASVRLSLVEAGTVEWRVTVNGPCVVPSDGSSKT